MRFQILPIPDRWKDSQSWILLTLVSLGWILALLITPGTQEAPLFGMKLISCPLKYLTGIPCPFCGLTRGTAWMVRGELGNAWTSNILSPLVALIMIAAAIYAVLVRLAAGKRLVFEAAANFRSALIWLTACLIAASWAVKLLGT